MMEMSPMPVWLTWPTAPRVVKYDDIEQMVIRKR